MAVIVSDTSPIRALHHLGLVHVLEPLFGDVLVPPAVAEELERPRFGSAAIRLADVANVRVRAPADAARVTALAVTLDPGEAEAVALAEEVAADELLIDELAGRAEAARLGLRTVGVLGVLLRAKKAGIIGDIGPLMDRLVAEIKFRIAPKLYQDVLRLAGE